MAKLFPHKALTYKMLGLIFTIRKEYGSAQKELVYQNALAELLDKEGINYKREVDIPIYSQETGKRLGNYRIDFVIENKIIVELKAMKFTPIKITQQVFSYLRNTPYEIGYLVNFGSSKLFYKRYILTNDRKTPSVSSVPSKSVDSVCLGFTFIELLVIIALTAVLVVVFIRFIDPITQLRKGWDGKRKTELSTMQKVFEDWYNDKNRFPTAAEICFNAASTPRTDDFGKTACSCEVCGKNAASPPSSPYLPSFPCDPQSTTREYLYDYDCSGSNPAFYRMYTKLSIETDPAITELGCQYGCGPAPDYAYNYGISSGVDLERDIKDCSLYALVYRKDIDGFCNICKSPSGDICNYGQETTYIDTGCNQACINL